jgi:protein SCO1/2
LKNKPILIIAGGFLMMGVITMVALIMYRPNLKTLKVFGKAPEFQITDPFGTVVDNRSLAGKIWVADFFFTSCPGACPVMASNLTKVQAKFKNHKEVKIVSFSVDPERDTQEALKGYVVKVKANPQQWYFLRTTIEDVTRISVDGFMLGDKENVINHSPKFALVDAYGLIRGYYDGTDEQETMEMIRDMKRLLRERH